MSWFLLTLRSYNFGRLRRDSGIVPSNSKKGRDKRCTFKIRREKGLNRKELKDTQPLSYSLLLSRYNTSRSPRLPRASEGTVPLSWFSNNPSKERLRNCPKVLGRVEERALLETSISLRSRQSEMESGMAPVITSGQWLKRIEARKHRGWETAVEVEKERIYHDVRSINPTGRLTVVEV